MTQFLINSLPRDVSDWEQTGLVLVALAEKDRHENATMNRPSAVNVIRFLLWCWFFNTEDVKLLDGHLSSAVMLEERRELSCVNICVKLVCG